MTRYLLSCMVLFVCLCCLPGCGGGGGGEAEFVPSDDVTAEELAEEAAYEAEMEAYAEMEEAQ
jgi:hypothetical protein